MKYIIDIPDDDDRFLIHDGQLSIPVTVGLEHEYAYETGLKLTLYTEPDRTKVELNDVHLCYSCERNKSLVDCPVTDEDILRGDGNCICCCNQYLPETTDRKQIEDEVWDFVREISEEVEVLEELYRLGIYEYSYQEAKAKYDAWMETNGNRESSIQVGDEIRSKITNRIGFVTHVTDLGVNVVWKIGGTGFHGYKNLEKTGRHYPQVAEVLTTMEGEE